MEFDEKLFPLEGQLAHFGPGERVDFGKVLKDHHSDAGHCQI